MPVERSSAEVRDIQREVSDLGFEALYARNDSFEEQVRALTDYVAYLPADLRRKEPIYSRELKVHIERFKGKLDRSRQIHVEPHSPLKRDETRADDLETSMANWRIRLDPNGWVSDAIRFGQTCKSEVPIWLEWTDWRLPTRRKGESNADYNKRCDDYRREWFGYRLQVDPVRTTAFTDYRRRITMGTRRFKLPMIDLARRYGDYKRGEERSVRDEAELMLQVCREQFEWVRVAEPRTEQEGDVGRKHVEVFSIDDGVNISHHIEAAGSLADKEDWKQLAPYRNPFGRPTLFIVSGIYNAGEPLEHRYEPLAVALIQALWNRDYLRSLLTSQVASKSEHDALQMPPQVAELWAKMGVDFPDVRRGADGSLLLLPGTPTSLTADTQEVIRYLLEAMEAEVSRVAPSGLLVGSEGQRVLEQATASAILKALGEEQEVLKSAELSTAAFERDVLEAIRHMYLHELNGHYKMGSGQKDKADEKVYVRTGGGEAAMIGRPVKPGTDIELLPADLDFPFTLTVTQLDDSQAAVAARGMEAQRRWESQPRTITWLDYLEETGVSNATEYSVKLSADQQAQLLAPRVQAAAQQHFVNYYSAFLGTPPQYLAGLLAGTGQAPQMAPSGPRGRGNGAGFGMKEPYVEASEAEAEGITL